VGIEQHLVALPRVGHQPEGTTGAQLQVGYLQFVEHAAHQQSLLAPVELEGLTQLETQGHKGPGGILGALQAPSANEVGHGAIATPVSLGLALCKQCLATAPCALGPVRIRAQGLLQCRHKRRELAIGLLALVLRGYVAGRLEPLLDRVSGQSRSSANLSVRELVAQLHAPYLANHVHGDHLLHPC